MPRKFKPSDLDEVYLFRIGEKLRNYQCPFCDLTAEQLSWRAKQDERAEEASEKLGRNTQYAEKEVPMIIKHIRAEHIKIYETLKDVFNQFLEANEQESLSKESLSRRIVADPELRRKLFHKWKELEETENRNQ